MLRLKAQGCQCYPATTLLVSYQMPQLYYTKAFTSWSPWKQVWVTKCTIFLWHPLIALSAAGSRCCTHIAQLGITMMDGAQGGLTKPCLAFWQPGGSSKHDTGLQHTHAWHMCSSSAASLHLSRPHVHLLHLFWAQQRWAQQELAAPALHPAWQSGHPSAWHPHP